MKKLILPTACLIAASMLPAFAATPTAGEAQTVPAARAEISVKALQEMQKAIKDDAPIFEALDLSTGWLEDLPPDEQFRDIANAINEKRPEGDGRTQAIAEIFGADYVEIMSGTLSDKDRTQKVETLLADAHQLFSDYENRNNVADWGWGDAWGVTITPNIGTLGLGIQAGYEFNKYFKIRGHYASGRLDTTIKLSDTRAELEWKNNNNYGVFFDWHPRGSQFRITAGIVRMDPRIRIEAKYHGTSLAYYDAGAGNYSYARYDVYSDYVMSGDWENEVCPYLGFGWSTDGGQKRTLYFSIDIGLAYVGEGTYKESGAAKFFTTPVNPPTGQAVGPTTQVHATDKQHTDALATLQQFDGNVRDAVDKIANFLNDMYVYPVVQFGGGIRF